MWRMENKRERDDKINHDVNNNRNIQHENSRSFAPNGFEGMNYEQRRESYRMGKSPHPQNNPEEERNLRRQDNGN